MCKLISEKKYQTSVLIKYTYFDATEATRIPSWDPQNHTAT